MGLKLDGMEELLKKIEGMANTEQVKRNALDEGAEHLRSKVSENTDRSTKEKQHAAENVIVEQKGDERDIGYTKEHYYMKFPEFGTKYMPAEGTVGKTFEKEKSTAQKKMADVIKKEYKL